MDTEQLQNYLATAAEMLDAEGMHECLVPAPARGTSVEVTGYDNWNGGARLWTIHGKHRGLRPRHPRLAVGAAVAFIDFVTATHNRRDEASKVEAKRSAT